jgi:D-alanyl-D-alanine carboxypeptidase (penicillin-binding protein 5/6)
MVRGVALLIFLVASLWVFDAKAALAAPIVTAPEAIAVDGWTGRVLYARSPDVMRAPASTVKVMTALVVLRHLSLRQLVTVNAAAVSYSGSTAGLYVGERMSVWNLLHGMLLPSGNDAAIALAEAAGGTPPQFVAMMNAEARQLGMWHTHYLTPNGFDMWGQVTTARDLASLARTAMRMPALARIVRSRYWTAWSADGRISHHWVNLNQLLWSSRSVDGVKTGTTPYAGACLVSSERVGAKWIIAVNLGSTVQSRFADGSALLNFGLQTEGARSSWR